MKYAVVTSALVVGLACEAFEVAQAQQAPGLPQVTIEPSKPRTEKQGQQVARQGNAAKKKRRSANRPAQPPASGGAPAQAGAVRTSGPLQRDPACAGKRTHGAIPELQGVPRVAAEL